MDLSPHLSALRHALVSSARPASEEVQEAADRLAQGLEPALRLALLELAAEVTAEVTVQLDGDIAEVRLRGGNPEVVVERRPELDDPAPPPPPPAPPLPPAEEEGTARVSLRLPEGLKGQVDRAAVRDGMSVNTWLVRAVQRAVAPPAPGDTAQTTSARRLDGWVR